MAQKQVKIGESVDPKAEEQKPSDIQLVMDSKAEIEPTIDTRKRLKSLPSGRRQMSFREQKKEEDKGKRENKVKTFQDFLADDVKPFRFLTNHFPHYQDHYQYPGYIPFNKRNISETQLAAGWDEKMDNERGRKIMIAERLKRKKRFARPGLILKRDQTKINPLRFDDPLILGETFVRRLSSKNPRYPQPLFQFHYYYGEYKEMVKPCDDHENLMRHTPGLIHIDSQEAQWQIEDEEAPDEVLSESSTEIEEEGEVEEEDDLFKVKSEQLKEEDEEEGDEEEEGEAEGEEEIEVVEEETKQDESAEERKKSSTPEETPAEIKEKLKLLEDEPPIRFRKSKKLFNLFNFTDRGIQGEVTMTGEKATQTVPVPMGRLNSNICNYIVYDVYQADVRKREEKARLEKLESMAIPPEEGEEEETDVVECEEESDEDTNASSFTWETAHRAKILERMIVQNTLFDYTADMKFYEDPIDEYNKEEGSLLPLWTFKRNEFQGLSVTCIKFCPSNPDIFGVTHGSFDFNNRAEKGYISTYSIKDPLNPEYKRECKEGVTAFDYHPQMESYLAYATYDGAVHICDTRDVSEGDGTGLDSNPVEGHQAFIWELMWDPSIEEFMCYSISADGLFLRWNIRNSIVVRSLALNLNYPPGIDVPYLTNPFPFLNEITDPKEVQAVATTMELDPNDNENVFVGTSDGMVLHCCLRFTTHYLFVYHSHCLPVSKIHFNYYIKTLFVTSGEDRRINIHEVGRRKPLYSFVQPNGVVDVMWAPYSSTVIALITADCRVSVYDLNLNSAKPLCDQFILWQYGKTSLTRLIFHPTRPILFVGDSSGTIVSFKLSPNLRVKPKKIKRQKMLEPFLMESNKLEACLHNTREPDEYPEALDDPTMLVEFDSESDEEETVRIGSRVYKVPAKKNRDDISRLVKRRVFEKYNELRNKHPKKE